MPEVNLFPVYKRILEEDYYFKYNITTNQFEKYGIVVTAEINEMIRAVEYLKSLKSKI